MSDPRGGDRGEAGQDRALASVRRFVERLLADRKPWTGEERRESPRHVYVAAVEMMPLHPQTREPLEAESRQVVSRDLSTSGIAVVCRGRIDWPEAGIRLCRSQDESVLVRARVLRVRPVGADHYEVRCMFVDKWGGSS